MVDALCWAGDAWGECNFANLTAFRDALPRAVRLVYAAGGLLPIEEYQQLTGLIDSFQKFQIGKRRSFGIMKIDLSVTPSGWVP